MAIDYEKDMNPDLNCLHIEFQRQPQLYMDYAKVAKGLEKERDILKEKIAVAKEDLAIAKAKLENDIREHPEKYNPPLKKSGEPDLKESWYSAVSLIWSKKDEGCLKAGSRLFELEKKLIDADYEVGMAHHALKAIGDQRSKSLENEALLWARGYFQLKDLNAKVYPVENERLGEVSARLREEGNKRKRGE